MLQDVFVFELRRLDSPCLQGFEVILNQRLTEGVSSGEYVDFDCIPSVQPGALGLRHETTLTPLGQMVMVGLELIDGLGGVVFGYQSFQFHLAFLVDRVGALEQVVEALRQGRHRDILALLIVPKQERMARYGGWGGMEDIRPGLVEVSA